MIKLRNWIIPFKLARLMVTHDTLKLTRVGDFGEMHSKRRYKVCICSAILGQLQSFRSYEGFSVTFRKNVDAILLTHYEGENFSDSSFL